MITWGGLAGGFGPAADFQERDLRRVGGPGVGPALRPGIFGRLRFNNLQAVA
jgi:hypothetical protein